MSLSARAGRIGRRVKSDLSLLLRHGTVHPAGVAVHEVDGLKLALDFSHPNQRQIYEEGGFEPALTDVICKLSQAGDVFVDIGANFGWHSLALLTRKPEVDFSYAFEPSIKMFDLLQRSIELNNLAARCEARRFAITDRSGRSTLKTFADLDPMHASLYPLADWDYEEQEVELTTLDSQVETFSAVPSLIKCDVECGERDVLLGARNLLAGKYGPPPLWLLEANYEAAGMAGYFPWELIDIAASEAPYQPYCIRGGRIVGATRRTSLRHGDTLILAVPEVHCSRLGACA